MPCSRLFHLYNIVQDYNRIKWLKALETQDHPQIVAGYSNYMMGEKASMICSWTHIDRIGKSFFGHRVGLVS